VYNSTQFYPWMRDEKSPTVINLHSRHDNYAAAQMPDGRWRQLEWQELARLQGFPEDYVFIGSPGRVGKQIGQAVQIDTARAILRALCAELQIIEKGKP
jgi:site-specific DNA-cytosine methylase